MTLNPATLLPASAIELVDDDGQPVATIYARASGIEIVCQHGFHAEFSENRRDDTTRLSVFFIYHRSSAT